MRAFGPASFRTSFVLLKVGLAGTGIVRVEPVGSSTANSSYCDIALVLGPLETFYVRLGEEDDWAISVLKEDPSSARPKKNGRCRVCVNAM